MNNSASSAAASAAAAAAAATASSAAANASSASAIEEYDDGRSFDNRAVQEITQEWVDDRMKQRQSEFTDSSNVGVFCGTWNVNTKKLDSDIHDWLLPQGQPMADVYAIGFQEVVDLNAVNVALDSSKTQQRAQYWQDTIAECFASVHEKYTLISERHLVGLLLCVYARDAVVEYISDVRSAQLGVGIMGMMGNKGGVSIRLNLFDSSLCFVCTHLAAHRENVLGRNSDFKNIYEKTLFPSDISRQATELADGFIERRRHDASRSEGIDLTIPNHDIIFWLGDLNYRIVEDIPTQMVFDLIERGDLQFLRTKDQLNIERAKGNVFAGFLEGDLTFAPTYKYQPGTDQYEQRPEKKLRAPAWCDRILWRLGESSIEAVNQLNYQRANLMPSDHKPVSAHFDARLRVVVSEKENELYNELIRNLEFWKNDNIPKVEITGLNIEFKSIKFNTKAEAQFQIKNVGDTLVHWRLVPKLEENRFSKRWIQMSVHRGLLFPEEVATVTVTLLVDKRTAQLLNLGKESLDDIIILRVEKQQDNYVNVSALYERSCFGVTLEELVYTNIPIRQTKLPSIKSAYTPFVNSAIDEANTLGVSAANNSNRIPKELWRLVDALWVSGAVKEKDIFNSPADPDEVSAIREALDCGTDFPECSPHSLAECLVTFLDALPRPLIGPEFYPNAPLEPQNIKIYCKRFLESLPTLNYNSFVYVISFLREVLSEADYNRSSPASLASLCVNCMTSLSDATTKDDREKRELKQQYMQEIFEFILTTASL